MKKTLSPLGKISIALAVAVVIGLAWYLGSPLFLDRVVDEHFPFALPSPEQMAEMSEQELAALEAEAMEASAALPPKAVAEEMIPVPGPEPIVLARGEFQDADNFHRGSGTVTLYQLTDQSVLLRFEDFAVTNGPDLRVLLATGPAPTSRADLEEGYTEIASLKGNIGNQNYEIPADVDVAEYRSVVIYCRPFHVVFATATLR